MHQRLDLGERALGPALLSAGKLDALMCDVGRQQAVPVAVHRRAATGEMKEEQPQRSPLITVGHMKPATWGRRHALRRHDSNAPPFARPDAVLAGPEADHAGPGAGLPPTARRRALESAPPRTPFRSIHGPAPPRAPGPA